MAPLSHQQQALPSETEGSLWWHRNFAKGDDALFNAQWELIEYVVSWVVQCASGMFLGIITFSSSLFAANRARIKERVQEEGMESLANISEKFMDNFPEYVTYPERKRLVDADKVNFGYATGACFLTLLFCIAYYLALTNHRTQPHAYNPARCSFLPGTAA
jgi:hypothetical protein|eukprot:evm.model.NODE_4407_length_63659_cov_22.504595.27